MVTIRPVARSIVCSSLAVVLLSAATAEAQTTLRWKFKPGDKLTYVTEQSTTSVGNVMGMEFETKMTQLTDMTWSVKSVDSQGVADMVQIIERIRMNMETPFGNFDYDSKENKPIEGPFGDAVGPVLGAMAGAEVSLKMDATGDIRDIKFPEKVLESVKDNPALAQFGQMFTEDGLKQMVQGGAGGVGAFPKSAISKGETWEKKAEMKMPAIGTMVIATSSTYAGPDSRDGTKIEKIELKMNQTIEPAPGGMFEIKITSQDSKGAAYFDNAAGRLLAQEMNQKMKMQIDVMGNTIEQEVDTTISIKLVPGGSK
jgi:hypothetical protein